ncbi:MAG: hypothetical protein ACOC3I_07330 [Verrucomicrobiota bacterium]
MESIPDLEKLRFYREELKHEFNLVNGRIMVLVTCQSFLVVPFAILNTAPRFSAILVPIYLVATLGIFVALILVRPIQAGNRMIEKWLLKQRRLLRANVALADLALERDLDPGAEESLTRDREHKRSLAFTRYGPAAFCLFWLAVAGWSTLRTVRGF